MTVQQLLLIDTTTACTLVKQKQDRLQVKEASNALLSVEVPKLTSKTWYLFYDAFLELLSRQIGTNGIPLTYITRTDDETGEYDDDYNTLNEKLVACIDHAEPKYAANYKTAHSLLSSYLKDSEAESTAKRYLRSRNGTLCQRAL